MYWTILVYFLVVLILPPSCQRQVWTRFDKQPWVTNGASNAFLSEGKWVVQNSRVMEGGWGKIVVWGEGEWDKTLCMEEGEWTETVNSGNVVVTNKRFVSEGGWYRSVMCEGGKWAETVLRGRVGGTKLSYEGSWDRILHWEISIFNFVSIEVFQKLLSINTNNKYHRTE